MNLFMLRYYYSCFNIFLLVPRISEETQNIVNITEENLWLGEKYFSCTSSKQTYNYFILIWQ